MTKMKQKSSEIGIFLFHLLSFVFLTSFSVGEWHFKSFPSLFFLFFKLLFISHMLQRYTFPSFHSQYSLFPQINSSSVSFWKKKIRAGLPGIFNAHGLTRHNKTKYKPWDHSWTWQASRRKGVPNRSKRVRDYPSPIVGRPTRTSNYTTIRYMQGPNSDPYRQGPCLSLRLLWTQTWTLSFASLAPTVLTRLC